MQENIQNAQDAQVENNKPEFATVQLPNGETATMLVADLNKDTELSVVSTSVLRFLTALLPKADMWRIKQAFKDKLVNVTTMEQYVALLREELEFHKSVNLIQSFFGDDLKPEVIGPKTFKRDRAYPASKDNVTGE